MKPKPTSRPVRPKPRTFDSFPENYVCPVCKTNDDGECVLLIDDTRYVEGKNIKKTIPVHMACSVANRINTLDTGTKLTYRIFK